MIKVKLIKVINRILEIFSCRRLFSSSGEIFVNDGCPVLDEPGVFSTVDGVPGVVAEHPRQLRY